jgi:hypothetical protein
MPSEWTLDTLRKHFTALREADREALRLQAAEYERRLDSLNGEQSRIAATQAAYVSRELWDRNQDDDRTWRSHTDIAMQQLLSKSEFQLYKETTNRALQVKEGEGRGIGVTMAAVLQFFSLLASVAAVIGVVLLAMRHS